MAFLASGNWLSGGITRHLDHGVSLLQSSQFAILLFQNLLVVFWWIAPTTLKVKEIDLLPRAVNQSCLLAARVQADEFLFHGNRRLGFLSTRLGCAITDDVRGSYSLRQTRTARGLRAGSKYQYQATHDYY